MNVAIVPLEQDAEPMLYVKEVHVCANGRMVLRRKAGYRELRYEVPMPDDALGNAQWRQAGEYEEYSILKSYVYQTIVQGGRHG